MAMGAVFGVTQSEKLTPERVFAAPDLSGPRARGVGLSPDGTMVTYLKAKPDDPRMTDLWGADITGGAPRMLIDGRALIPKNRTLSEAEKSRRERQGVQSHGVVDYDWDEQGRFILAPVEGDLWLWTRRDGSVEPLTHGGGDHIDARLSPHGRFVSYVRTDNLYVMPSTGGAERAITTGGRELTSWATAEFIAQEEMGRRTGRYPRAGRANAIVTVTHDDWPVDSIAGVDQSRGVVLFTANKETPIERSRNQAARSPARIRIRARRRARGSTGPRSGVRNDRRKRR